MSLPTIYGSRTYRYCLPCSHQIPFRSQAMSPSRLFLIALVALLCSFQSQARAADPAAGPVWFEKLDDAVAAAKKGGRPVLADFTGSDWCHWCKQLKSEVFDTKAFKDWAAANVVLLEVDFPQQKAQSAEIKKQNEALAKQFKIEGFPTVLILDAAGKKHGELGYEEGGPVNWIAKFKAQ